MNRREVLQYVSILLGGSLVGANGFISGCRNVDREKVHSLDIALLDEIAETILPETSTPGAKAAQVGAFMALMVNECYSREQQRIFEDGLEKIDRLSSEQYGVLFVKATPQQRNTLLVNLDKESKEFMKHKKPEDQSHYFRMMKELTLLGYFTSEIGCTIARRYVPIPGKFEGCIPYKKGDKKFA